MDIYTSKVNELKRKIAKIEDENDMDDIKRKSSKHQNKQYLKRKNKKTKSTTTTNNDDDEDNRKAYNLNKTYKRLKSQLKTCEANLLLLEEIVQSDVSSESSVSEDEESSDDSQSSASSRGTISDTDLENQVCANCFRKNSRFLLDLNNPKYTINFEEHPRNSVLKRNNLRHAQSRRDDTSPITLCSECSMHLKANETESNETESKDGSTDQFAWPSFMWGLLTNKSVHEVLGINVWKFVPLLWRHWWIPSLLIFYPTIFSEVTIQQPSPFFVDRTIDYDQMKNDIESYKLSKLMSTSNKYLLPDVLCPWGESEYMIQCGYVPLDLVTQRFIPKCRIDLIGTVDKMNTVRSARDDFVRELNDYDFWVFNPNWKILPTIIFVKDKGPCVCTSRNHNDGSLKDFIHLPRQPSNHILPSKITSQVSHVVPKPQTIKPMVAHKYSNTYQMHKQTGSFQGVSSIGVVDIGNFESCSILLDQYESQSIAFRPDVNSHLDKLSKEGFLTNESVQAKRRRAKELFPNPQDFEKYAHGSTYISLEDSVSIQKSIGTEQLIDVEWDQRGQDENEEDLPDTINMCRRNWCSHIFLCQKMDAGKYGERFPVLPTFSSNDNATNNKVLFILSSLLTSVKELWSLTDQVSPMRQSEWHGWVLAFLSSKCFPHITCGRDKRNPFKKSLAQSVGDISKYFNNLDAIESLSQVFERHEKVLVSDMVNSPSPSNEEGAHNDVIIFSGGPVSLVEDNVQVHDYMYVGSDVFELRVLVAMNSYTDRGQQKWRGDVYARHGGIHKSWWTYSSKINERYPIQIDDPYHHGADHLKSTCCSVYVKVKKPNFESLRNDFLTYIGGDKHIQCEYHKLPLICSHGRKNKCTHCKSRNEAVCCPDLNCNVCLCKKCADECDERNLTFIQYSDLDNDGDEGDSTDEEIEEFYDSIEGDDEENSVDPEDIWYDCDDEEDDRVNENHSYDFDMEMFGYHDESVQPENKMIGATKSDDESSESSSEVSDKTPRAYRSDEELDDYSDTEYGVVEDCSLDGQENDTDNYDQQEGFQNFVTQGGLFEDFDALNIEGDDDSNKDDAHNDVTLIPTTDAGNMCVEVEQKSGIGSYLSGHVILNQCGSLLSRLKDKIKGFSGQKNFLQRLCSTIKGESIPLAFPDAMVFSSLFWYMVPGNFSYAGAIPAALLSEKTSSYGIASIKEHVQNRLTVPFSTASTDPGYIAFCYDMLSNLTMSYNDSRIVLNRGFTVDQGSSTGLGVRCKKDSSLFDSVDSKQMVKNLSASQKYHSMDFFLTFTCNMKKHFGVSFLKNWIDGVEWENYYPDFHDLDDVEKNEIRQAVQQAAGPLILRNWLEVRKYFIEYLLKSPSSPYIDVGALFARDEYQAEVGNLPHIHLMLSINWEKLNQSQKDSINDLIRASVCNIVRHDEVDQLIEEGLLESVDDVEDVENDGKIILPHRCNQRCLVRVSDGDGPEAFRCKKQNNLKISSDNTKHTLKPIHTKLTAACMERLRKIGLGHGGGEDDVNEYGWEGEFVSFHPFFRPMRHIPSTNANLDMNISPVETRTFVACRSMQNIQSLTHSNGCNRYVVKYVGKLDRGSYVIFSCNPNKLGAITAEANFLHNTKISTSAFNEDKAFNKRRDKSHPCGRVISQNEMLHHMLGYKEVTTNMEFVSIPTSPFELRAGVLEKKCDDTSDNDDLNDAAVAGVEIDNIRRAADLEYWRRHRDPELLILENAKKSNISVDKISLFSVRPPELRHVFRKVGDYYRWFHIDPDRLKKRADISALISDDVYKSAWVDGLKHKVKLREKALPEVCQYFEKESDISNEINPDDPIYIMRELFLKLNLLLENESIGELIENENDREFLEFAKTHLLHYDNADHLPIPVYSFTKPTMGAQFILHILLSMGSFETEIDLTLHESLRESFRYAKLIGPSDDHIQLEEYSNKLLRRFIEEQLVTFPNSMRVLDRWIVEAGELFDSVIIHNKIPITEMPPVQQTTLNDIQHEKMDKFWKESKKSLVKAALNELSFAINECSIPSEEELLGVTKNNPLSWNSLDCFSAFTDQSDESYKEQKLAIQNATEGIDRFCDLYSSSTFNKCRITHGAPGSGKSFIMQYLLLYAMSKGLKVMSTAVMARRANQLGGKHIHKLFGLDAKDSSPYRKAELAIIKLLRDPVKINVLRSIEVLCLDECGQVSAETLSVLDNVLRRIRGSNIFMGGVLILGTMDHTQLSPVKGHPFLVSSHIIPCFQMVQLKHSVRASRDPDFLRIQEIARYHPSKYTRENISEFKRLCRKVFTFAESWQDECITPSTVRLYGKKKPGREATMSYVDLVKNVLPSDQFVERKSDDVQNPQFSHQEWQPASELVSRKLDSALKEPRSLIFFQGAVYEFTYNDPNNTFTQSSLCILYELPSHEQVNNFQRIKVLAAPAGIKDHEFDPNKSLQDYLSEGWYETFVSTAQERPILAGNYIQAQRRQYGLKHRVTSTIHASMGDTLVKVAIQISESSNNFKLWDKAQVIVAISRTKVGANTIFVGDCNSTINALASLIQQKSQWTDYMEKVLDIVTINSDARDEGENFFIHTRTYPYRICDIPLPDCNTGYVYMLVSCKEQNFSYIGETISICRRLQQHNSGYGSSSTSPPYLRPFAVFALICGFDGNKSLRRYVESAWKRERDKLIREGVLCLKRWALCGNDVISSINRDTWNFDPSQLRLLFFFNDFNDS